MFYTVILIDHFTLWQKGQRKLWNPLFCITISWDASVMPICQHTKTRCCSTHQVAKNRIGKYNNGFFYFFMFDTWFITSFRSCCIAYFKDKSAKKLCRRKIEMDFFPAIFSWFTNIAYAILRDLILSQELHNQIVIDAWH